MHNKTKILIIRSKELIYGAIICFLIILFIIMLVISLNKEESQPTITPDNNSTYISGIYTSSIQLSGNPLEIEVCIENDKICSISLLNSSEYITTMYPLLEETVNSLSSQICSSNTTDNIKINENNQYTSMLLLDAIREALSKATFNHYN